MSELHEGKLQVRKVKKGLQIVLEFPTKKGTDTKPVENVLSADLHELVKQKKQQELDGVEVQYERDPKNGQPVKVRKKGGTFQGRSSARGEPQRRGGKPQHPGQHGKGQKKKHGGGHSKFRTTEPLFHNPYNFVPALPRQKAAQSGSELGDRPPTTHDGYHADKYSGVLHVEMETATPLAIVDAATAEEDERGHKTFEMRVAADGKTPYIPPTSVKGMLRAAYESVTNSRMGVFHGHDERLASRMNARDGLAMVPARIEGNQIRLLLGTTDDIPYGEPGNWRVPGDLQYAAWLPRYFRDGIDKFAPRYPDNRLPEHGDKVWCWLELYQHYRLDIRRGFVKDFKYWKVVKIAPTEGELGGEPDSRRDTNPPPDWSGRPPHELKRERKKSHHQSLTTRIKEPGSVCITNQNISRKHDERVFFLASDHPLSDQCVFELETPIAKDPLIQGWKELVSDYQKAHREREIWERRDRRGRPVQNPEQYVGRDPGDTAWSRHIYMDGKNRRDNGQPQIDAKVIQSPANDLCYARVERVQAGKLEVRALYPVMIARELFPAAPAELLDDSLRPAKSLEKLSPAERVFGWVTQRRRGAYRGNLRIGPVRCESENPIEEFADPQGLPLTILGQPKPQQSRFYCAEDEQGTPLQGPKSAGYQKKNGKRQGLRGRKVYPHHANLPAEYWANDPANVGGRTREFRHVRDKDGNDQRSDQNRSLRSWIKAGQKFSFDIHVTNLSQVELGALLWLLNLPENHYHRLGGGKPLGLGSVRLTLKDCELQTGQERAASYQTLASEPPPSGLPSASDHIGAFLEEVKQVYANANEEAQNVRFLQAFLASARGFDRPVHYPRQSSKPDPQGENFKWFTDNEQGPRVWLGALWQPDEGLPFIEREK